MQKAQHFDLEDIDEAQMCIRQRQLLMEVRRFLDACAAGDHLIEAVDMALEDNEQWAIEEVEHAIQSGLIKEGST